MSLAVLFVCTGNICRSPAAAALTAFSAAPEAGLQVGSVGLAALVGAPVDPPIVAALAARNVTCRTRATQQFEPWMALDAGLVLTFSTAQSAQVLREVPQALRRVFTLKEFVRLADAAGVTSDDPHDVVAGAAAARGRVAPAPAGADDVVDPYRRGDAFAAATVAELAAATDGLLRVLGAGPRRAVAATNRGPAPTVRRRPQPYPR